MAETPLAQIRNCDVLVIGGGINGAGTARDLAGRGFSTLLCEKDDLAGHTSSASTKLIHGGLRYLEQYEFRLVRKALIEREVLMRCAPHLIRPLAFILPHDDSRRPAWLVRAGLLVYDCLAKRRLLARSHAVDLRTHAAGAALQPRLIRGFRYFDGWVDDARLVVHNALDAAQRGAAVLSRTACVELRRSEQGWVATLADRDGRLMTVRARAVVDACGPWAGRLSRAASSQSAPHSAPTQIPLRLVKGSHIVVKKLFAHDDAYLFQHADGRVIFAIPYERDFTLIGTTDIDFDGDLDRVSIGPGEIAYLCGAVSHYFRQPVVPQDVVWSYAGVRPLQADDAGASAASGMTRDYRLVLDSAGAPLLTVLGGKLTTFRRLAEEAADLIGTALGRPPSHWTANSCLPGGDLHGALPSNRSVLEFDDWVAQQSLHHPWLPSSLLQRYARSYGTRMTVLLAGATALEGLGAEILPELYAAEIAYLVQHEWACCAEDILWRRTKRGLHLPADAAERLDAWLFLTYPKLN